jgi:hypothetical protein
VWHPTYPTCNKSINNKSPLIRDQHYEISLKTQVAISISSTSNDEFRYTRTTSGNTTENIHEQFHKNVQLKAEIPDISEILELAMSYSDSCDTASEQTHRF